MNTKADTRRRKLSLKNIRMKPKMIGLFLVVGLLPIAVLGILASRAAEKSLMKQSFAQLEAVSALKKNEVEHYFQNTAAQVQQFSNDLMIISAMKDFSAAYDTFRDELSASGMTSDSIHKSLDRYYTHDFGAEYAKRNNGSKAPDQELFDALSEDAVALQYAYIANNTNPLGQKNILDSASNGTQYDDVHHRVHSILREYLEAFGFYDVFLVDMEGRVVYTQFKELDFATSLTAGPYAQTGLARAYRKARDAKDPHSVVLEDFERYVASYDEPASFIATPIFDGETKVGVALFQMPLKRINAIMTERAGMGTSGESYVVGPDRLMRSDSYLDPQYHTVAASFAHPDTGTVDTEATRAALNGESGSAVIDDYNGNVVLSAYTPVQVCGLQWALLSEIDLAEVQAPIRALTMKIIFVGAILCLAVVALAYMVASALASPIVRASQFAGVVAKGDLTQQTDIDQNDEIGGLAIALNAMTSNLRVVVNDIVNTATTLMSSSTTMADTSNSVTDEMNAMTTQAASAAAATEQAASNIKNVAAAIEEISCSANNVASSSEEVSTSLTAVGAAVEQMSVNMNSVSSAVEESTTAVNTIAASVEEMSASLAEVSSNTSNAAAVAREAADGARDSADSVHRLGASAKQIDKVIDLITSIAQQTNLLALNATIEAASAGEAGKGFAVVANEVKALAEQTSRATDEIRDQVTTMQADTSSAVSAITGIVTVIERVNDAFATIASAVHEQTIAIGEISRNVADAARGGDEVSRNVQEAAIGTAEISRNVQQAITAVNDIARSVTELAEGANEIARNAAEASQGTETVAQSVTQVDSVASNTRESAGRLSSSAGDLNQLANKLTTLVSQFSV